MRAAVSYCEPWHGQKYPPYLPRLSPSWIPSGMQPRWVPTPSVITEFFLPALVRCSSGCGARRSSSGIASASAISLGVRLRTNNGCLRNEVMTPCPGSILDRSTTVVDSASTSADGLIWLISGTSTATPPPTAGNATAAMYRKSQRRGSWPVSGGVPSGTASSTVAIQPKPLHIESGWRTLEDGVWSRARHCASVPTEARGLIDTGAALCQRLFDEDSALPPRYCRECRHDPAARGVHGRGSRPDRADGDCVR